MVYLIEGRETSREVFLMCIETAINENLELNAEQIEVDSTSGNLRKAIFNKNSAQGWRWIK